MKYPCDLCGATEQLPLPGDPSGKIGICRGCGFCYVSERRSIEEVAKAWTDIYASGGYDPSWPGVKARLFYVAEWLDQHVGLKDKELLDVGSGNGLFLQYTRNCGARCAGLDPDPGNVTKAQMLGVYCFDGYAERGREPIGQFDIVTLNWTLENTGDCISVLEYAKSCLKPDGIIAVATGSRISVPYKKRISDYIPQDPEYPHDTHCFRWSYYSLAKALAKCGLALTTANDFEQRDEMILIGVPAPDHDYGHDIPGQVWNFFYDWKESWP